MFFYMSNVSYIHDPCTLNLCKEFLLCYDNCIWQRPVVLYQQQKHIGYHYNPVQTVGLIVWWFFCFPRKKLENPVPIFEKDGQRECCRTICSLTKVLSIYNALHLEHGLCQFCCCCCCFSLYLIIHNEEADKL